ncbi:MAG TPA: C25 family cysteine peptidase [Candidatus Krumholzibacteria bacterium]|nr:C25 family cysteine peptidase [Candidatus Krumholzibacteria bacterium]HRX50235.1 C25 family cysteine peptidase [Candidatus Krumholzibacteria bacterium]
MSRRARVRSALWRTTVFCVLLGLAPAAFAAPLRVTASDDRSLTLHVELDAPDWQAVAAAGPWSAYATPSLPGFAPVGEPGAPRVPGLGRWIAVPPGHTAEVEILNARWHELDGRLVVPTPVPVRRVGPDGEDVLGEELVLPGETPRTGEPVLEESQRLAMVRADAQAAAAKLGEIQEWRGHRIAALSLRPVEVDAAGRARRSLAAADVRVTFRPDPASVGKRASGPADPQFSGFLLNGDRLAVWPTERSVAAGPLKRAAAKGTLLRPELRIPVTKTGLVRLDANTLDRAGLVDLTGVQERQIRLYQRRYDADGPGLYNEIEVPIHMVGDGGDFGGDDHFVFWGLRVRDDVAFSQGDVTYPDAGDPHETFNPAAADPVNSGNIYYLAVSEPDAGEAWARMESIALPAAGGTDVASYRRTDYREEDTFHCYQPTDITVDRNHWNSQLDGTVSRDLDAVSPVPGRSDVTVRAGVVGLGEAVRSYTISLAGASNWTLGTLTGVDYDGGVFDSQLAGVPVQSDWLADASLSVFNAATPTRMLGWLDWFEVSYEAEYLAVENALEFHLGDGTGLRRVQVRGFTTSDLALFDVSDPRAPKAVALTAANVADAGDGTWTLTIAADQAGAGLRRFRAVGGDLAASLPLYQYYRVSTVTEAADPTAVSGSPDVLVITHPEFRAQAEQWADYRAARSAVPLEFHIVDVHQVFDWFSGGLKNPDAIKRLCSYASTQWGTWALQIFGDASENTRALNAGAEARDWVPSRWHVWEQIGYQHEVLPSDAWFANPAAGDDYPDDTYVPAEMIVARFPCNSTEELGIMLDKLRDFENASDGEAWKGRLTVLADDAWSDGIQGSGSQQSYRFNEEAFESSQESLAARWEDLGGADAWSAGILNASRLYLADVLDPYSPTPPDLRDLYAMWDKVEELALTPYFAQINQGAMMFHYQGHANDYQMAHERVFYDTEVNGERSDVDDLLANGGKPFIFVGLGCHLATWTRDTVESNPRTLPSLGEKMLRKPGVGAVAVYASPGFEFLNNNATFAGVMGNVWLDHPPRDLAGPAGRSRWVLGELFLASQADLLAAGTSTFSRRLVAQYALLGDGLMVLDVAPPRLQLSQDWEAVPDGAQVTLSDKSNELVLTLEAFDEAGVDRLAVRDDGGADVAATVTGGTPEGAESDQYAVWEIRVPVTPATETLVFHVYDTADVGDDAPHATTTVHLPNSVVLYRDGLLFTPGEDEFDGGTPTSFTGRLVASAFLSESAELLLEGDAVELTGVTLTRVDDHTVDFAFTVEVSGADPALWLRVDGAPVEIPLWSDTSVDPTGGEIIDQFVYPNPVRDEASFIFRCDTTAAGRIHLYTVSGHRIATIPVAVSDFVRAGEALVRWDGRDDQGDRPANGTYLYRVELDGPDGTLHGGMQRVVLMR